MLDSCKEFVDEYIKQPELWALYTKILAKIQQTINNKVNFLIWVFCLAAVKPNTLNF